MEAILYFAEHIQSRYLFLIQVHGSNVMNPDLNMSLFALLPASPSLITHHTLEVTVHHMHSIIISFYEAQVIKAKP